MKKYIFSIFLFTLFFSSIEISSLFFVIKIGESQLTSISSLLAGRLIYELFDERISKLLNNQLNLKRSLFVVLLLQVSLLGLSSWSENISIYVYLLVVGTLIPAFKERVFYLYEKGYKYEAIGKMRRTIELLSYTSILFYVASEALVIMPNLYTLGSTVCGVMISILLLYNTTGIWNKSVKHNHLIENDQKRRLVASMSTEKKYYRLKDSFKVWEIISIQSLILGMSILVLLNLDVLEVIRYIFFLIIGFAISIPVRAYTVARIRTSYLIQNSYMFLGILILARDSNLSNIYLYGLCCVFGVTYSLTLLSVKTYLFQTSKQSNIRRSLKSWQIINLIVGILVPMSTLYISFDVSAYYSYAAIGCMVLIVLLRAIKKKVREMTYVKYK